MALLSTVNASRGAPLGRREHTCPKAWQPAPKFSLCRIRLNSGGYDSGGAYWGLGPRLYYAAASRDDDGSMIADRYFRARDREAAKTHLRREFPDARFYR